MRLLDHSSFDPDNNRVRFTIPSESAVPILWRPAKKIKRGTRWDHDLCSVKVGIMKSVLSD
jgi:hypothetical protein